jgi:hypothetical protein
MTKKKQAKKTAGELSNDFGIPLVEVKKMTNVSLQTLDNWHKNKPLLFKIVIYGCKWVKKFNITL